MGRCCATKELRSIPACFAVWVPSSYTDHYLRKTPHYAKGMVEIKQENLVNSFCCA